MPAAIRDVMPAFELFQPTSVADTLGLLDRHGADAWAMAGGLDTFDWLKDRIRRPKIVVDLSGVAELRGISAGRALLVLSRRVAVLPRRRQHLLRRYADLGQP